MAVKTKYSKLLIRLPEDVLQKLRDKSEENGRSMTKQIETLIKNMK